MKAPGTPLLAIAALAAAACLPTDEGEPNPLEAVAGTYALVSIDTEALPAAIDDIEISGGTLVLTAEGAYTATVSGTDLPDGASWEDTFTGTFALDGSTITLSQAVDFYPAPGTAADGAIDLPLGAEPGETTWTFRFEQ